MARQRLALVSWFKQEWIEEVCEMILATEEVLKPDVPDLTPDQWVVVGLDLYSFGTSEYWKNIPKIRHEMSHLSNAEWREGRVKFLRVMLEKDLIIGMPFFERIKGGDIDAVKICELWHCEAHANINAELRCV